MDAETLLTAIALMKKMPDNAANSAAQAAASAQDAQDAADSVTVAAGSELKTYLGIS